MLRQRPDIEKCTENYVDIASRQGNIGNLVRVTQVKLTLELF